MIHVRQSFKAFLLVFTVAVFSCGTSFAPSSADQDRFDVWDQLDAATATLLNNQQISENENRDFEEVLGLGRSGHTEEAIKALSTFLKSNRNTALREVATATMKELMLERRKNAATTKQRIDAEKTACTLEMKVCPNGVTLVSREGPRCDFAACPAN